MVSQYNTIQYNTIQYNTIQYNTIQYNTIQYNTIQYNTIQYNTIQYNTMQCNAMQYNTIQYNTIQYNTIQYNTIQYNTIQYNNNTIQYNTIQHNTTQHNTTQHNAMQCSQRAAQSPPPPPRDEAASVRCGGTGQGGSRQPGKWDYCSARDCCISEEDGMGRIAVRGVWGPQYVTAPGQRAVKRWAAPEQGAWGPRIQMPLKLRGCRGRSKPKVRVQWTCCQAQQTMPGWGGGGGRL